MAKLHGLAALGALAALMWVRRGAGSTVVPFPTASVVLLIGLFLYCMWHFLLPDTRPRSKGWWWGGGGGKPLARCEGWVPAVPTWWMEWYGSGWDSG